MLIVEPLYRLFRAMRNYRNPLSIIFGRTIGSSIVQVQDRRTGLTFRCRRGADHMMSETFYALIYDVGFAPIREGDVVIDVGANHGFYSCWAARQGAIVHAFEPDPNTYKLLLQNIALNGLGDRIFPHQAAIAAKTGQFQMYCTADMGGGLSTIIPAFAEKSGIDVISQINVQALSMADALKQCDVSQIRVCKMDCEGAEQSILAGLDAATRDQFDAFVLEYHPQAYELDQFMDVLLGWDGFHISKVVGHDRDLGNANLSAVRKDVIRQWSSVRPAESIHERIRAAPAPIATGAKQAMA